MLGRHSCHPNLVPLDPEVEKSLRALHAISSKVANLSVFAPIPIDMADEPKLPLKDNFMLNEYTNLTCIQMPAATGQFEIKPSTISHMPNFYGKSNEDPYQHLNEFNDLCTTFNVQHLTENALKLRLFPFSVRPEDFRG